MKRKLYIENDEHSHTEVKHWGGRVIAGSIVGNEVDFPLSLLLLDSQFGTAMAVRAETAEKDQYSPQQPEP